jgi:hypothetical protein
VPRARSKALGTGTLCREQKIQLSAQKKLAVQTYCAEREQSGLSAQPPTHGTEELCRELQKLAKIKIKMPSSLSCSKKWASSLFFYIYFANRYEHRIAF